MSAPDLSAEHFEVETYREGKYWMVSIPAFDGLTQALSREDVELSAREYISSTTGEPFRDIAVRVREISAPRGEDR